ncbi:MAG: hypothetical protein HY590_00285 [Candidatus Omnitrophica bacterium]|nr:hypothetical protein [Candidatus Omnitrophota bacterium]
MRNKSRRSSFVKRISLHASRDTKYALIVLLLLITPTWAESILLKDLPPLPQDTFLTPAERKFGFRGRIGGFNLEPSRYGCFVDGTMFYPEGKDKEAVKYLYDRRSEKEFVGTYLIIMANLSQYKTMTFYIKGEKGGETFELGLNDVISNKREDAVFVGSIYRYLPQGITTEWQRVAVPLSDWFGPDLSRVYSIVFHFNEIGKGAFWIDEVTFHTEQRVDREAEIEKQGYLLLDNFDHDDLNLLGRKTNCYKKLPSVCVFNHVSEPRWGGKGRSLQLSYQKEGTGWCGYYTLLNEIDGAFFDLSWYDRLTFMVKGERGGEIFEIGMADRNWLTIGDSVKAGPIEAYLPGGVTTEWQEVTIPLQDFGLLDFSQMGSFVINFYKKQEGVLYIDDLKFHLRK